MEVDGSDDFPGDFHGPAVSFPGCNKQTIGTYAIVALQKHQERLRGAGGSGWFLENSGAQGLGFLDFSHL